VKIHFEPKVILLARPSIDWDGVDAFLGEYGEEATWRRGDSDSEGDSLPELAGRACYGSFGKNQGRIGSVDYLSHVIESGHGSVLEHAQWTFAICRASRGFTHQMIRHRAGCAFSQESQHFIHYAEEGKGTQEPAVCLTGIPEGPAREFAISETARSAKGYERLWDLIRATLPADVAVKKIVSGSSRGLLPGASESRLVMSANARALRHVIELRGNEANTLEIRLVVVQLARLMKVEAPAIFADFEEMIAVDGFPVMSCKWRKV
jgi:thymidylate synthase (FAD)